MKTTISIKKTINSFIMKIKFFLIIATVLLAACSYSDDIVSSIEYESPSDSTIIVGINLAGEISLEEALLTRSEPVSTDLIGIQVYKNGNRFCNGLFDCLDNVKVKLKAGATYRFVCTMIKDGKSKLAHRDDNNYCYYPFYIGYTAEYNQYGGSSPKELDNFCTNTFIYRNYISGAEVLGSGCVDMSCHNPRKGYAVHRSEWNYWQPVDRFYGEITDYSPTVNGSVIIPLRRVSCGIKVSVSGVTDGSVHVKCYNDYNTFYENYSITNNAESTGEMYCMYNVFDAWKYADDDYQETIKLNVIWTRGNGIVQDLGTKTMYVKRNAMNIIKVKFSTNDSDVDVDVDPEGGEMGNEDEDLSN